MAAKSEKKIIYFVPHQDDELLTMGIDIASCVEEGYEVFIVLCTDGSRSRIRELLNDKSRCEKCKSTHNFSLSVEEFVKARDREFFACCAALGVKNENILFDRKRITDSCLTEEKAKALIKKHLELLGKNCTVKTIYPNDAAIQHHDHRTLGLAAKELKDEGVIERLELMEEPYVATKVSHKKEDEPRIIKADGNISLKIKNAVSQYSLFNPEIGRFAIGYHSVTREMELLKTEMQLYKHIYF